MSSRADEILQPYCPAKRAATRFGDAPFLMGPEGVLSFTTFAHLVGRFADKLRTQGIQANDRVGMIIPTSENTLALFPALWRLGTLVCPFDPVAPRDSVIDRITELNCYTTIILKYTLERVPVRTWGLDFLTDLLPPKRITGPLTRHGKNSPCTAILTSGSSGRPKAVVLSLMALTHAAQRACKHLNLTASDRYLLNLPMHHVSGLSVFMRCLESGAQCLLPNPDEKTVDAIARLKPTHLSLVATQLRRALDHSGARDALCAAKCVLLGGGPTPEGLLAEAVAAGIPLMNSYGMTETAAMICATSVGADVNELRTAGKPLAPNTLRVNDKGMIEVRGNTLFLGYLQDNTLYVPEGWFPTNDLGHFDETGRLCIDGRADRMFIVGGENVQPETVEAEIRRIPGVKQAVVVPMPDKELGFVPVAFVEVNKEMVKDRVIAALAQRLPRHAVPRHIFPWPEVLFKGIKPRMGDFQNLASMLIPHLKK